MQKKKRKKNFFAKFFKKLRKRFLKRYLKHFKAFWWLLCEQKTLKTKQILTCRSNYEPDFSLGTMLMFGRVRGGSDFEFEFEFARFWDFCWFFPWSRFHSPHCIRSWVQTPWMFKKVGGHWRTQSLDHGPISVNMFGGHWQRLFSHRVPATVSQHWRESIHACPGYRSTIVRVFIHYPVLIFIDTILIHWFKQNYLNVAVPESTIFWLKNGSFRYRCLNARALK